MEKLWGFCRFICQLLNFPSKIISTWLHETSYYASMELWMFLANQQLSSTTAKLCHLKWFAINYMVLWFIFCSKFSYIAGYLASYIALTSHTSTAYTHHGQLDLMYWLFYQSTSLFFNLSGNIRQIFERGYLALYHSHFI